MRLGLDELNWENLGAALAQAGSDEQIMFFKAFVKECKSWETSFQVEKQLASINLSLTTDERQCLSMIGWRAEG